jgi:PQQ enzyme repeat
VWGFFTIDAKRGIVYAPLGSPTDDFYGADRVGDNLYGNSLVALDARSGEKKWHQELVHHDIWDYDLAAPPALFDIRRNGRVVPAVAQITKMGLLFVFDRVTGKPVYGIEERPVPQTEVPGEATAKTQPFPVKPPPLGKNTFRLEEMYDRSPEHARFCKELFDTNQMKIGGPYTPLPLEGNGRRKLERGVGGSFARSPVRECDARGAVGTHGKARFRLCAHLGFRTICAVLESRDAHTLPEPALWGDDRRRPCVGGHRVAISAGENRGPRGDRGARYGIFEPGRQHSHRGRSRVHRGSQRFQILSEPELPRTRAENDACFRLFLLSS